MKNYLFIILLILLSQASFASRNLEDEMKVPEHKINVRLLAEDIPGIEDNYLRSSICCWRGASYFMECMAMITTAVTPVLIGISNTEGFDARTKRTLEIAAMASGSAATLFQVLHRFSRKTIKDHKEDLREVLQDGV